MMSFEDFFARLNGVKLARAQSSEADRYGNGLSDQEHILRLLYNIGFVGFYLKSKSLAARRFETPWVFIFNEGDSILTMQSDVSRKEIQLVIHPIFIEYLGLSPYRDVLVCEFDQDYLVRQEAHQVASVG
mgnify:FL=1